MTLSPQNDESSKVELNIRDAHVVETFASSTKRRFYAHRTRRNVLVLELEFDNINGTEDKSFSLTTRSVKESEDLALHTIQNGTDVSIQIGQNEKPENKTNPQTIAIVTSTAPESIVVKAGEMRTLRLLSVFLLENNPNVSFNVTIERALHIFESAMNLESKLRSEHESAWNDLWSRGGVEIESSSSNLATQINSSFYYMLSSIREDVTQGLGPGGLQTNGYKGNYYWDNDLWAMPSFLPFWPELAETGLRYRFEHRTQAEEHAKEHDKEGYWYPFQTAGTGVETDLFEPANKLEIHVGGGVALLGQLFVNATGNATFEREVVEPIVRGVADFYVSMAKKESDGTYSLDNVVPPDEYAVGTFYTGVKNSVYTNSIAALTAAYACKLAGAECSTSWTDLSSKLKILVENEGTENEWHPEYQDFPKKNPFWNGGGKVKQADVTMLYFPMNRALSDISLRNDLEKYEPLYDPEGPAMTLSVSVVLWLRLDEVDRANALLLNSTKNMQEPFNVWTESANKDQHQTLKDEGCFNFLTGAGGFLQSIAYGYGGLKFGRNELEMRPTLPLDAKSMKFRSIEYHGGRFSFEISSNPHCEVCALLGDFEISWHGSDSFVPLHSGHCSRANLTSNCTHLKVIRSTV